MREEYKLTLILAIIGIVMIVSRVLMIAIDNYNRERCYNMPINQYVEEKSCEKYTWEEYMEENYGK